jgi:hypothetical protein
MSDLPIIQKTYDLIKWYVPILNRLPRDHKLLLGDRIIKVVGWVEALRNPTFYSFELSEISKRWVTTQDKLFVEPRYIWCV